MSTPRCRSTLMLSPTTPSASCAPVLVAFTSIRGVLTAVNRWRARSFDSACLRILVEVEAVAEPAAAVALASRIDAILDDGLIEAPRLHHGGGVATWAVIATAIDRGHDVRIGLEDTLVDADGVLADGNEALVKTARRAQQTRAPLDTRALSGPKRRRPAAL